MMRICWWMMMAMVLFPPTPTFRTTQRWMTRRLERTKPTWQPQRDVGDFVVVTNVADVIVTGPKMEKKMYYRHTGFPGGLRVLSMEELIKKNPVEPLRKAVVGMLPKNKLRGQRLRRLRLFPGPEHVHEPQLRDAAAGSYVATLPVGDRPATFRRYEAPQRHD